MKFLRLVFRNVFRKKTRTLLTMGSIVLALVLTVVLTSLLATLERENSEGKGGTRVFVQHASGLGYFLPLSHRQKIEPIPGVLAVTPEVWFGGTYIDQRPQNFFGQLSTDPETWKTIFDDFSIDPAQLTAWQSPSRHRSFRALLHPPLWHHARALETDSRRPRCAAGTSNLTENSSVRKGRPLRHAAGSPTANPYRRS